MKKTISALIVLLMLISQFAIAASADSKSKVLQTYFTEDGETLKIFLSQKLDDDAQVLIANEQFPATIKNSNVQINTVFLIDNSTSMPYNQRDTIKKAINKYVADMPSNEKVKIAKFDKKTTFLADDYSRDKEYIKYELSKVDFNGQASLVYDALLKVVNSASVKNDVYYRTILITDGVDSEEGTSFEYLKSQISDNSRYHVDIVQSSETNKKDVNLKAISELSSNTFTLFNDKKSFASLKPKTVAMLKVKLSNSVTTGELKGVTVKNGEESISLGSIIFPQVEIEESVVSTEEDSEEEDTASDETDSMETDTEETVSSPDEPEKKEGGSTLFVVGIVLIVLLVIGGGVAAFIFIRAKNAKSCYVSVIIRKDDARDTDGVGNNVWKFPVNSEFRVGRTFSPISNDNKPLPKNHYAICERATAEDATSIGRTAFSLKYDKKTNALTIKNIASGAIFSIQTPDRKFDMKSGQTSMITVGNNILLGNYTTVTIQDITIND